MQDTEGNSATFKIKNYLLLNAVLSPLLFFIFAFLTNVLFIMVRGDSPIYDPLYKFLTIALLVGFPLIPTVIITKVNIWKFKNPTLIDLRRNILQYGVCSYFTGKCKLIKIALKDVRNFKIRDETHTIYASAKKDSDGAIRTPGHYENVRNITVEVLAGKEWHFIKMPDIRQAMQFCQYIQDNR